MDETPPDEYPRYDTKQSDDDYVPVIPELSGMQRIPSLTSLPGPLLPGVVAPERVLSKGQIELNCVLIKSKVKLATVVEGDQKAPFSIATKLRCRGGCYSFPWTAPLYPQYVPYIAEC